MSFTFVALPKQFNHTDAIRTLSNTLNKGDKPPVILDKIEVAELEMVTQVRLRMVYLAHAIRDLATSRTRDIGELTANQFCGIFIFTYNGDVRMVLLFTTTPQSDTLSGQSFEPQATRQSPHDQFKGHVGS